MTNALLCETNVFLYMVQPPKYKTHLRKPGSGSGGGGHPPLLPIENLNRDKLSYFVPGRNRGYFSHIQHSQCPIGSTQA